MFGLGMGELLVILVIVLLIFGAGKLPQVGDAMGRAIRNFRSSANSENQIEVSKKKELTGAEIHEEAEIAATPAVKPAEKKR
jgi:sec-independent protein translocase protein TatA